MARPGALTPPGSGDGYQRSVQSHLASSLGAHLARPLRNGCAGALVLGLASSATSAQAQPAGAAPGPAASAPSREAGAAPGPVATSLAPGPPPTPSAEPATEPTRPALALTGLVESYYQWNFNDPSNGLTNARGFDNRHNSFTLSNVALDAQFDDGALLGRLVLQVGAAPSTYYLAEPARPGSGAASASGPELWKYLQQAYAGYRFEIPALARLAPARADRGLSVTAGLFVSPIGPESLAVRDNWTWSRSNLFFGLPFYHAGARAQAPVSEHLQLTVAVTNGWNDVVDNNEEKSLWAQLLYSDATRTASLVAFTGVERPSGAAEGRAFRHLLDAHLTWHLSPALSVLVHGDAGLEPNELGTSRWIAGALAARLALGPTLLLAGRADAFAEHVAANDAGAAAPIFWPVAWIASGTLTLEARPHPRASLRLELRHDLAEADLFFGGAVAGDGAATPYVPNRDHQTTATLGATTWL